MEESFNRNNPHSKFVKAASDHIQTGSANCIGGSVELEVPGGGARRPTRSKLVLEAATAAVSRRQGSWIVSVKILLRSGPVERLKVP